MPPRFAYWTILVGGAATAFRTREREELLPTVTQLRRRNADVVLRYFSNGKLWDSPEQARWAGKNARPQTPHRDRTWRPGGEHKDPRARFGKERPQKKRDARPHSEGQRERQGRDAREGEHRRPHASEGDARRAAGHSEKPRRESAHTKHAQTRRDAQPRHEGQHRQEGQHRHAPARRRDRKPRDDREPRNDREQRHTGKPWQDRQPRHDSRGDPRGQRQDASAPRGQNQERGPKAPDRDRRATFKAREPWKRRPAAKPQRPPVERSHQSPPPGRRDRGDIPIERLEAEPRPRTDASPDQPPAAERVVVRPKPPERG